MTDLRKEARGRDCMIRSDVCSHNPEETVLAHLRMADITGMGMKAPDILGAWSCYRCHVLCDTGRYVDVQMTREDRERLFFRGMARTINQLAKDGKLLCE